MATLQLHLPEPLDAFVALQATAAGYPSVSEYILALIREAQLAKEKAELEAKLLAGVQALDRGEGKEWTASDWERMKARFREQAG